MTMRDCPEDRRIARRRLLSAAATGPALVALGAASVARAGTAPAPGGLDVRDRGARGDGRADDTAAIQAAIDAASARGGGAVTFPPGTYLSRTLTLRSRVHLVGSGAEATVIQLAPGTEGDLIRSEGFFEKTGTNDKGGIDSFGLRHLTLDGGRPRNRKGCGLRVYGYGYILDGVRIRACAEVGLYSEWSTEGMVDRGDSMEAQVANLKVHDCGAGGIHFRGPHDSQFVNCIVYDGTTWGVRLEQGEKYSAVGCQFVNAHVWGRNQYAWKIDADFATLVNCMGEWAGAAQVHVNGNDATIVAGRFFGDSKDRHVGIEIGSADRVVYGTQLDARMSDLAGGALKFTNEGGSSKIKALIYQTAGVPYVGTPAATSLLELIVNGIEGGSATAFPRGSLSWNGGAAIVRHLSGVAAWEPAQVSHGAATWTTVRVERAAPGDTVAVGYSEPIPAGALLSGIISERTRKFR